MKVRYYRWLARTYRTIRITSYTLGTLGLVVMLYAKISGSEDTIIWGYLIMGGTFSLFFISYLVYWAIRLIPVDQEGEQINP